MLRFIKWLLILSILVIVVAGAVGNHYFTQYQQQELPQDVASFEIKRGSNIRQIANQLEKQNILKPALAFMLMAKLNKQDTKIKAGEFSLTKGMRPEQVLNHFIQGRPIQYTTTIIEGHTFKDIVKLIKADPNLVQTLSDNDYKNIMKLMETKQGEQYPQPEGWFYPDTYSYPRNTTDLQFLKRSHKMMVKKLQQAWLDRTPHPRIKTPYQALILASIVEKETGQSSERPLIAQVFLNRLRKGMMLQTDPTIIYGLGEQFDGNIRKKDLKTDNPYNTYTRTGLPPTPIATPGAEAVQAVFHPADSKALYFVAKGDGTSYFSETYSEHKKAVIRYQLKGNAKKYQGEK